MIFELIISLICFLGLFVGFFIASKTVEELKPGTKYFVYLQKALFILTIFFVLYEYGYLLLGLIAVILFSIFLFWSKKNFDRLMYLVLSLSLFLGFFNQSIVIPSLIFFYGFPTGTIYYMKSKKVSGLFFENYYFLIVLIVLLVVREFL
ncbi:MAG: hypothetical protein KJ583_00090 [Nanoarchaeota archaeon]|nr:hypothetical protein [Nanoarchaeota archaeon]MBU1270474.1 hypothetical protein [Nanoarchaeota archaeon]MBU1603687.1 hypothetical protein [Nanoarchaeota archaeon]MBU2443718.1 hypothetical protein [Nanoarchaeota archaeon]